MSLVIITQDGLEHRYVVNQILRSHPVTAICVVDPPLGRSWQEVLRKSPTRFFDKALRQIYLRAIRDATVRKRTLRGTLGPDADSFLHPELIVHVGDPKGEKFTDKISQLAPSIIAVYGTGIIPDAVLSQARHIALNMHTGISPWYRGVACYLWPLIDGDSEKIGATIHECTSKIDGGRIFYTGKAALYRDDNIHAIFARSVIVGAKGYVEVLEEAVSGVLTGVPQDLSIGREYRGSMIGLTSEIGARRALARLSKRWPLDTRT